MTESAVPATATSISQPVMEFEGEFVRSMEGTLPKITLDMPEGYRRGMHLQLGVEVRVRNVAYVEDSKGDLARVHTFALEEVKLTDAFDPATRPESSTVGGSNSGAAWRGILMDYLEGHDDVLDFDGAPIPDRLREILEEGIPTAQLDLIEAREAAMPIDPMHDADF